MTLQWIDWLAIGAYVLVIACAGLLLSRRPKSSEDYFLAGRSLRWPFIGASLFAANISAEHFVGLAGSGYSGGMAVGGYEWSAVFCLVPLIALFLPFYIRNRIFTVPEFLEQRYGTGIRLFFSGFMVLLSVLTKISISLWASSLVFASLLGWNPLAVIWVVGLGTALYTMKGGLRIVVYTDALQTAVLLVAAVILTVVGLRHVGGWGGLHARLAPEMFSMVRPATDPDYPWPGMFFGVFLAGSFYWSMDQVLVQRAFAARDLNEGRKGAILCGFLKLTTPFLLVLPGLIAKAMFPHLPKAHQAYRAPPAAHHARRPPRPDDQRHRRRAHGAHQRDLQLDLDAVHPRLLPALAPRRVPGPADPRRARGRPLGVRAGLALGADDRALRQPLHVPPDDPGVPDAPVRGHLLRRRPLEADDDAGRGRVPVHRGRCLPPADDQRPAALPAVHGGAALTAVAPRGHARLRGLDGGPGGGEPRDPAHLRREAVQHHRVRLGDPEKNSVR